MKNLKKNSIFSKKNSYFRVNSWILVHGNAIQSFFLTWKKGAQMFVFVFAFEHQNDLVSHCCDRDVPKRYLSYVSRHWYTRIHDEKSLFCHFMYVNCIQMHRNYTQFHFQQSMKEPSTVLYHFIRLNWVSNWKQLCLCVEYERSKEKYLKSAVENNGMCGVKRCEITWTKLISIESSI